MSTNKIEDFFDNLASSWDDGELISDKEKEELLDLVNIKENDTVLDVACGTGVITGLIHKRSKTNVVGIDLSSKMIEIAKEKYKNESWAAFIHKDLFDLEEKEKYDKIIIYNAYPHFMNPEKLSKKIHSLLKKDGTFSILHSMSRKQLDMHHKNVPYDISRHLDEPKEEFKHFQNEFDAVLLDETNHSYMIIGKKK